MSYVFCDEEVNCLWRHTAQQLKLVMQQLLAGAAGLASPLDTIKTATSTTSPLHSTFANIIQLERNTNSNSHQKHSVGFQVD
jgi:hypothetical protein